MTKSLLTSQDIKKIIVDFLDERKLQDIVDIDLIGKSSMADYLVIASGTSQRQVGAAAELLREELKKNGLKNIGIEGLTNCDWVLVDTGDIIVHLFRPEVRSFYDIEGIWGIDSPKNPEAIEF